MYKIELVELEITNLCAHRCPYCYLGDVGKTEQSYVSDIATIYKVIDKLSQYGAKMIALLGGDPVLHPQIIDIIKYIKSNTSIAVSIMSNTLDFAGYSVGEMAPYIDNIDFTLHGRTATEHETFCCAKSGLYNQIVEKLKKYILLGVNVNIAINLTPTTYDKIYEMVASMFHNGVRFSTLLLQRIIPYGKACGSQSYDITKKQIAIAMQQIEQAEKDFGIGISFEDPFPLCCVEEKYHKYMKGCPEGVSRIPIRGDGRISSCGVVGDRNLGNILTDSYESIWVKNARYEEFRSGSFLTNRKCVSCKYKIKCRGGCPVRYMLSEDSGGSFLDKFEDDDI